MNTKLFLAVTPYRLISSYPLSEKRSQAARDCLPDRGWLYPEGRATHRQAWAYPRTTETTGRGITGIRTVFRGNSTVMTAEVPDYRSFAILLLFCWTSELARGHVSRFAMLSFFHCCCVAHTWRDARRGIFMM
jgi:hypothetical protein